MYRTTVRPIYGDTDAMGVVYHGNYLRFFEKARTDYLRELGLPYGEVEARGVGLPVVEAVVRYHHPARYDQLLAVELTTGWLKKASLRFDYRVLLLEDASERLLCSGHTVHACMIGGKLAALPPWLRSTVPGAPDDETD